MANGLNRVQWIGNIGMDPELKYTQSGMAFLRLRVASSESWIDKQTGEKKERTEWMTFILWGKRAEALAKILSKGERVYVEGKLQTRQWETDQGEKRYSTEVRVDEVILLGGRRQSGSSSGGDFGGGSSSGGGAAPMGAGDDFGDDDIPFLPVDGRLP